MHHRGAPGIALIFLFAAGAMAAWGTLRLGSRGASEDSGLQIEDGPHLGRAGVIHIAAVGGAIAVATLLSEIPSGLAWPLASFGATLVYMCVIAVEMTLREREETCP